MNIKLAIVALTAVLASSSIFAATGPVFCPSAAEVKTAKYNTSVNNDIQFFDLGNNVVVTHGPTSKAAAETLLSNITNPNFPTATAVNIAPYTVLYYCTYAPDAKNYTDKPSVTWAEVVVGSHEKLSSEQTKSEFLKLENK